MPPPERVNFALYKSSAPPPSPVRPEITTQPGDLRTGCVSVRFNCAVKPLAAHAATPRLPLPSGMKSIGLVLAVDRTIFDCATTFATSTWNDPFCQAVLIPPLGTDVSNQLRFMPPFSMNQRRTCCPALRLMPVLVMVVKVCQAPVLGTVIVPVTLLPSTSMWKVEPVFGDATRKSRLYVPLKLTLTVYLYQSLLFVQPTSAPPPASDVVSICAASSLR